MKTSSAIIFIVIIGALVGGLILYASWSRNNTSPGNIPEEQVFCTLDAKMCPDGSFVGRVPPTCEFAACPVSTTTPDGANATTTRLQATVETRLGRSMNALGLKIVPREVLEDSRCPADVVCVQAGTVRVRADVGASLGTSSHIFSFNTPVTIDTYHVTLAEVQPLSRSGVTIPSSEYKFFFVVKEQ